MSAVLPRAGGYRLQLLLAALGIAALLMVSGSVALSLRTTDRLSESVASVSQIQRVLEQINRLWGVLGDRDRYILRYLLNGHPDDLQDFERTLKQMHTAAAQLQALVGHDAAQRARLERLDELHRERVARARGLIALKQRELAGDAEAAAELDAEFDGSPGSSNAEAMRQLLDQMAIREKGLLAERGRERTEMIAANRRTVIVANALALLAGIGVWLTTRRLLRREREARQAHFEAEQARRADHEKSELLTVQQRLARERQQGLDLIAHDLRQYLGNILFSLDLLQSTEAADRRQDLVRTVRGAANGGLLFLRAVLEQGAVEARGEEAGPVRLRDAVREVLDDQLATAAAKRIGLQCHVDAGLCVHAQPSVLRHVLQNLVSNALKYSPEGAAVEIEAGPGDDRVVLRVLDRGPGVPEAEQPALFRRYSRLSPQPSGGEETTGLGLALARQRARAQGADLRYEDRPGGGACFRLEWPLA